jgi:flagellar biosynthesis chaperone FliJ
MKKIVYPLEEILNIKRRKVDEAVRAVKEKEKLLQKEREKLKIAQTARDKVLNHKNDKLNQFYDIIDQETTTDKIQQSKKYLEFVEEKLIIEEGKVKTQQEEVDTAKNHLQEAQNDLRTRRKEVEKFEKHKERWMKEVKKELEQEEIKNLDEIGSVMFLNKSKKH